MGGLNMFHDMESQGRLQFLEQIILSDALNSAVILMFSLIFSLGNVHMDLMESAIVT